MPRKCLSLCFHLSVSTIHGILRWNTFCSAIGVFDLDNRIPPILTGNLRSYLSKIIHRVFHKIIYNSSFFTLWSANTQIVSISCILKGRVCSCWRYLFKIFLVKVFIVCLWFLFLFKLLDLGFSNFIFSLNSSSDAQCSPLHSWLSNWASKCTNRCSVRWGHLRSVRPVETDVVSCLSLYNWSNLRHLFPSRNASRSHGTCRILRNNLVNNTILALELNSLLLDHHELSWVKLKIECDLTSKLNVRTL